MVRAIEDDRDSQNAAAGAANALKEAIMKIRKVENGLALVGALFILLAVAVAATSALNNKLGVDFPQLDQTFTLVARS
jgi:uncharacterized membrane protein